jgi:hypothetical protein
MTLPWYTSRYPIPISQGYACVPGNTSDTSGGASWVSSDALRGFLPIQKLTLETKECWRVEAFMFIGTQPQKVRYFSFSVALTLFLTFYKVVIIIISLRMPSTWMPSIPEAPHPETLCFLRLLMTDNSFVKPFRNVIYAV